MQFLKLLQFHYVSLLVGGALGIGGLYKALTYIAQPEGPLSSPFPFRAMYWFIAFSGFVIILRALIVWISNGKCDFKR